MTKTALKTLAGAASALFLLGIHTLAAGTEKIRAEAYFNAISGGNPETIASFYADNAEFHWVGGPLAGVYTGKAQIKSVWERFIKAAGDIDHKVLELSESQKGKLSTVTARVNFIGPAEVPVRFTMVYENGKIVNEIWEVDKPVIGVARTDVKPETSVQPEEQAKAEVKPDEPAKNEAQPQELAKAEAVTPSAGKDAASDVPPAPEKRVDVAETGKDAGTTPPLPEHSTAAANDDEAKAPGVKGTPTPLPPSFSNAPKKSALKPSVAPKKREAQKDAAKNDGLKKKKSPSEYAQRDDDNDDDYDRYADDYSDYDRRPYYGYYGRPYYRPSFRFRFGNDGYGYRNYNRYGYYGYGRY
jgi:hypothetical protein